MVITHIYKKYIDFYCKFLYKKYLKNKNKIFLRKQKVVINNKSNKKQVK